MKPTEHDRSLLDEIQRLKAELVQVQNKAHIAGIERDEARVARDFAEHRADKLESKCAEEKKWSEELAKDLCEMEDALGFKQDQTDANGAFVPTKVPWLERVRDLISAESELVDVKDSVRRIVAERDAAVSHFARMKESLFCAKYAFDNCAGFLWKPNVGCLRWNFAEISAAVDSALSTDCGKGWVRSGSRSFKVICLCGSTRFTDQMLIKQWELTKSGFVVLSWCALPESYFKGPHVGDAEGVKEIVDEVHKRKIDLSDEVLILNVNGYFGESTTSEIVYAIRHGKPVKWLNPPSQDQLARLQKLVGEKI